MLILYGNEIPNMRGHHYDRSRGYLTVKVRMSHCNKVDRSARHSLLALIFLLLCLVDITAMCVQYILHTKSYVSHLLYIIKTTPPLDHSHSLK